MLYKDFRGMKLSALGFGAMRLPSKEGGIDEQKTNDMVSYAYENGVNYFDTAYSYNGGQSERVLGSALKRFPRESYYLADKFPGHEIRDSYDPQFIFEKQLEKCGVEYFDFYLLHNVYANSIKTYRDKNWGIVEYLLKQKEKGRIKHFGFSAHAMPELLNEFLDEFGQHMEFAQIQLNWLDWTLQRGKEKYELLTSRKLPVWVMEPVRGGALIKLSAENAAMLKAKRPDESVASWSFRWLQGLPNVCMTLSGMSEPEQVKDNIKTFSGGEPLDKDERAMLEKIASGMADMLPCTGCRYCTAACPQLLDIPTLLSFYNDCRFSPSLTPGMAIDALEPEKRPSACVACGNCKKVCPQGIDVPAALADFAKLHAAMPRWTDISAQRAKLD